METINSLLMALRAVAEPTRLRLLALCAQGELTVSELVGILGQSQPRVSRHLKLLTEAGLLERIREGSWVFHRLVQGGESENLARRLNEMLPIEDETLSRDRERLLLVKRERERAASDYFKGNADSWDRLRSLHVDDSVVERVLLNMLDGRRVDDLLDVGTGTGRMLELFSPLIGHGEGIDLSREMLSVARANLQRAEVSNCAVRQADIFQIPFGAASYDVVTIHQVLHFLDRPGLAVSEAVRTLRPEGLMLLVDFAPHELESLRDEHKHWRLGFDDEEVASWFLSNNMDLLKTEKLVGDPLTVTVWLGQKKGNSPTLKTMDGNF
ncbi:MAG TPA: metalloregulator ArsR/SmtB family transcription factor [Rhodospirillales bacterium]|nr:metalloregulator ArsR/SmtB family transcription factor [Rhodospirillales bacterium]